MGFFNKENRNEEQALGQYSLQVDKKPEKRLFLVDYENVADAGLVGVDALTESDYVVVYYGSKIKSVAYESLIAITASKAAIEHLKAEKTAKNYLDFQLTTYLGFLLGKNKYGEVRIISKDSGFDAVVDFWSAKGVDIGRRPAIAENPVEEKPKAEKPKAVKKPVKKTAQPTGSADAKTRSELRAALKPCGLTAPEYKKVYDAFDKSDSAVGYNNTLQKSFESDKTGEIYHATVKIFEKEHKQN